jgi:NADH:ubiquinone oxidoreductase subunit
MILLGLEMQLIDKIIIKFLAKEVGKDSLGNKYFESFFKDYLGRSRRFIKYSGIDEPTKIPVEWHSWIHFLTDKIPSLDNSTYKWQKLRQPNLTGTTRNEPLQRWIKKDNYIKWEPK